MRARQLATILERHDLSQRNVADATGLAISAVSDIVNGKRSPTTTTVNRLLRYLRRYEPSLTYEALFGKGLAEPIADKATA